MNTVNPEFALAACYHCGASVSAGIDRYAKIGGVPRPMCCAGCQAVAETIAGNGLDAYYAQREALPAQPGGQDTGDDPELYDLPEVQQTLTGELTQDGRFVREVSLLLEGVHCSSCVWLVERRLVALPGVVSATVNYAARRARVTWDPARVRLSSILRAVATLGYRATPWAAARADAAYRREQRDALRRLFVAGLAMMQVMMYALPVYVADAGSMSADVVQLMRLAGLVLTAPVVFYSAWPILARALRDFGTGRAGMDIPVALGIAAAFAASAAATLRADGEVYFDSIAMFVFLLLAARYAELAARRRAAAGIERLAQSVPAVADRLADYPQSLATAKVAAVALAAGDHLLVAPGACIPADGILVSRSACVDEALLTGESLARSKVTGDAVTGGTLNLDAPIVVRVTETGARTRLAAIMRLLERALGEKPGIVAAADRFAGYFLATVLLAAAAAGCVWLLLEPARAPWVVVAVLIVTCPCALSLAAPAALTAATARMAALGAIVTRGHAIEALARADTFVFDKTGTLTENRVHLDAIAPLGTLDKEACLRLAAALEQGSDHPVASAFREAAAGRVLAVPARLRAVTGRGIEGDIDGKTLRLGSPSFVAELAGGEAPEVIGAGGAVALGTDGAWLAGFALGDRLRPGAADAVRELARRGQRVLLLSGDGAAAVARIAREAGIAEWRAGLDPEAKHAALLRLQGEGRVVAMLGDGVNDAPALGLAQVSIAMGSGAPLAQANADMVWLGVDLRGFSAAVAVARRSMRIVRQNLVWAAAYNALALPLAMTGWVNPWLAGVGMAGSSLLVTANALRLAPRHSPEKV